MIAYRMLYAVAVGLPVVVAVHVVAGALRRHGRAERGVWVAGLLIALMLPAVLMTRPMDLVRSRGPTPVEAAGVSPVVGDEAPPGGWMLPTVVVQRPAGSSPGLDWALLAAWVLTSLGLAVRWAVSARRLASISSDWRADTLDGSEVWITPGSGPAVTGAFHTRILVPEWLRALPSEQRALVLLHEEEHVRARDPWLMTVSRVARIATPWNPLVWLLTSRLLRAVETDCDRRVLRRRPGVREYCDTLLTISARQPDRLVGAAAFAEPQVPLQKRILAMTTPSRSLSAVTVILLLAVGSLLVFGSCGVPLPTERDAVVQPGVLQTPGWFQVVVQQDGTVLLNDEPHPMADVSTVATALVAASPDPLVTVVDAAADVPYRFVSEVQEQLVAARAVRVVFVGSRGATTPFADNFSIVLPEAGAQMPLDVNVSQRNLLKINVLPSSWVEIRRGAADEVQLLRAGQIADLWRQAVLENPSLIAALTADRDATYSHVLAVLNALHDANAQRISLGGVSAQ